jgi:hypothetical protein
VVEKALNSTPHTEEDILSEGAWSEHGVIEMGGTKWREYIQGVDEETVS